MYDFSSDYCPAVCAYLEQAALAAPFISKAGLSEEGKRGGGGEGREGEEGDSSSEREDKNQSTRYSGHGHDIAHDIYPTRTTIESRGRGELEREQRGIGMIGGIGGERISRTSHYSPHTPNNTDVQRESTVSYNSQSSYY